MDKASVTSSTGLRGAVVKLRLGSSAVAILLTPSSSKNGVEGHVEQRFWCMLVKKINWPNYKVNATVLERNIRFRRYDANWEQWTITGLLRKHESLASQSTCALWRRLMAVSPGGLCGGAVGVWCTELVAMSHSVPLQPEWELCLHCHQSKEHFTGFPCLQSC